MQSCDNLRSLSDIVQRLTAAARAGNISACAPLLVELSVLYMKGSPSVPEMTETVRAAREVLSAAVGSSQGRREALIQLGEVLAYLPVDTSAELVSQTNDLLGVEHAQEGNWQAALMCFNKAVALESVSRRALPSRSLPYIHLSQVYIHLGNIRQALRYASQAVSYSEEDFSKQCSPELKTRLEELYRILSGCEEALGRPERSKFWRDRQWQVLGCNGRRNSWKGPSQSMPSGPSSEERLHWPPRLHQTHSEFTVSADTSTTETSTNSLKRRVSVESGTLSSSQSSVVFPLRPVVRRASEVINELSTRLSSRPNRRVSLRISPRPLDTSHEGVIVQVWRKLSSGQSASISLTEGSDSSWKLQLSTCNSPILQKIIEKNHPWRSFDPKALVGMVDIDEQNQLTLSYPLQDSPDEESPGIELLTERKQCGRNTLNFHYIADEDLKEVWITTVLGDQSLRKVVYNDVGLKSQEELKRYVTEVLSPQVTIFGGKIVLRPTAQTSTECLYQSRSVVPPNFPCVLSVYRVTAGQTTCWRIVGKSATQEAVAEFTAEEAEKATSTTDPKVCAEKLAELAVLTGDSVLSLSCKPLSKDMAIFVTPAEADNAPKEYQRKYEPGTPQLSTPRWGPPAPEQKAAATTIQRYFRQYQAKKRAAITKRRGSRCLLLRASNSGSKQPPQKAESAGNGHSLQFAVNQPQDSQKTESVYTYVGNGLVEPKKHLIATRDQLIGSSKYQVSVFSRDGHVEIRALKLHKSL